MIKSAIKWTLCIGVLVFVVYYLVEQIQRIDWSTVHINPWMILGGGFFLLLVPPVQLTSYRTLLGAYAQSPPWKVMAAVAWVPPLGKYVPGKVASVTGAILLLQRFRIPATIAISVVLAMDGLALVTGIMLGVPLIRHVVPNGIIPAMVILVCGIICLHPIVFSRMLNFGLAVLKRPPLDHMPDWRHYILPVICAFAQWTFAGIALWMITRSVAYVEVSQIPRFISIATLGYTIGYLALFSSNGIGPRDIVFATLIALVIKPAEMGSVAAVLVRIVQTITEMSAALVGWIMLKKLDREQSNSLTGK